MKTTSGIVLVALVTFAAGARPAAPPADHAAPRKEPRYRTTPAYGLLLLDDDVGKAVWLARDHDTLYVDRNGNGDLTEPGEAFRPAEERGGVVTFRVPRLVIPGVRREYRNLVVHVHLPSRKREIEELWVVEMDVGGQGRPFGSLVPTERPNKAGRLLFGAPLRLTLPWGVELRRGEPADLYVSITTPPRPVPTAGAIHDKGIPAGTHPVAEVTFPGKVPGKTITAHCPLAKRC
jgi:hypothetical protein